LTSLIEKLFQADIYFSIQIILYAIRITLHTCRAVLLFHFTFQQKHVLEIFRRKGELFVEINMELIPM